MQVPINITGQSYVSRSRPLSAQKTQNFYAELVDNESAKSPYVLHSFPGMLLFGSEAGCDRGMLFHNQVLYKVTGATLYSVSPSGAHTSLGSIPGVGRCIMDGIGANVVVVTDGKAHLWNGSTVAEITDPDLETPNACTHLNNQIIYDGDGGRFASSDVGDATSIDSLNYATAESNADDLIRPYAFDERLYLFGNKTTEVWWNSGVGKPPFDRIEGGLMEVGLEALHSVAHNDDGMFFLGDDSHVYRVQGPTRQAVTSNAVHRDIARNATVSDAIGFTFTLEGQNFYCLVLPGQDRSYLFSETGGWFDLSSGSSGGRTYANSYAFAYRKHLIADYRNGNIYEWDLDTYTDGGDTVIRIRDTAPIHGGLFGLPGKKVEMNSFELIMETGTGVVSGQGSDPKVALSFSDDGGKTWSTEMWASIGKLGEFVHEVRWNALGSFYERILRVMVSDPVYVSIHSASADLEVGI